MATMVSLGAGQPPHAPPLILILGGARSGKSHYAESLATRLAGDGPVLYVATATVTDDEMAARIAAHRAQRPAHWQTLEAPLAPGRDLRADAGWPQARVVLLDCISILVSNLMLDGDHAAYDETHFDMDAAEMRVTAALDDLLITIRSGAATTILVSNEVGLGVVPAYPLGRAYRDILGRVNARLARIADLAAFMVAGQPLDLHTLASAWETRLARTLGDDGEPG